MWNQFLLFSLLIKPKTFLVKVFKNLFKFKIDNSVTKKINKILLQEKIIKKKLSYEEIISYVDFHTPTAGKFNKNRGFNINLIKKTYLSKYSNENQETYNHLGKITPKNNFTKKYSKKISKISPDKGSLFFVIYKKNE